MPNRFVFVFALLLSAALPSACTTGPMRSDHAGRALRETEQVAAWPPAAGAQQTTYLNQLIRSAQLDALLRESLAANPGLQQTLLTLKIRRAEQRQTGAARLPAVDAGLAAARDRDSGSEYSSALSVSWEIDLWGKLADEYAAAGKDVAQQQALTQAAQDTLVAEVMRAWLGLIARTRAIEIEQRRLDTLTRNERFILQRYRNGLGTLEDLDSARSTTASARATLAEYRESLAQLQRSLQTLLARTGELRIDIPAAYPDVALPLAGLPRQTLQRRPDLRAAYMAIQAQDLRTSVAYKNLLPSIDIEAALSSATRSAGSALLTDPVWSLLAQLTAPLYQGGRLRAEVEIAKLQTELAYEAYRETLLTAVQEVGDALGQERALAERQAHVATALARARNSLAQYQRSYRIGLVDVLELLIVQRQTYDLEAQLDDLVYQRLLNRVALGLALGLGVDPEGRA